MQHHLDAVVAQVLREPRQVRRRPAHILLDEVAIDQQSHVVGQVDEVTSQGKHQVAAAFDEAGLVVTTLAQQ